MDTSRLLHLSPVLVLRGSNKLITSYTIPWHGGEIQLQVYACLFIMYVMGFFSAAAAHMRLLICLSNTLCCICCIIGHSSILFSIVRETSQYLSYLNAWLQNFH